MRKLSLAHPVGLTKKSFVNLESTLVFCFVCCNVISTIYSMKFPRGGGGATHIFSVRGRAAARVIIVLKFGSMIGSIFVIIDSERSL